MTDSLVEDYLVADRSTLQAFAECPRQAQFIQQKRVLVTNSLMESGNGVHHAISCAITEYVESHGAMGIGDIAERIMHEAYGARPDVQPDVVAGIRPSVWQISKYIHNLHHDNIVVWDGGTGERSGQLSIEFPDIGVKATSEIDLLHSGPSIEVLHELDWKSGHKHYTSDIVADDFQFQMHALLAFTKFPDIKALNVRIWNTRLSNVSYSVLFHRRDYEQYYGRVHSAAAEFAKWSRTDAENVEPWPITERCGSCPAAALCDASKLPMETPEEIVDRLSIVQAHADALSALAADAVRRTGREIVTERGNHFGTGKPKRTNAPKMELYSPKKKEKESAPDA